MIRVLLSLIFLFLVGCNANTDSFEDYEQLRTSSYENWLPSYFPKKAKNIKISTNLDSDSVNVSFTLDPNHSNQFNSYLLQLQPRNPNQYFVKNNLKSGMSNWCIADVFDEKEEMNNSWMILIKKSNDRYLLFSISQNDYESFCD